MDRALFLLLLLVPAKNVEVVGESGQTACRQFFLRFSRASPRACLPACLRSGRKPTGEKRNMSDRSQMIFTVWNLPNGFSRIDVGFRLNSGFFSLKMILTNSA
jgi:hypothetical protein